MFVWAKPDFFFFNFFLICCSFLPVAEGRDVLQPALQQLDELRQEQSRISTLLSTALEETQNLTGEESSCTHS